MSGSVQQDTPRDYRIALRPIDDTADGGPLDDIVVRDVSLFRAEMMSKRELFMSCDFPDSDERLTFWVRVHKGQLQIHATEIPSGEQFVYEDEL